MKNCPLHITLLLCALLACSACTKDIADVSCSGRRIIFASSCEGGTKTIPSSLTIDDLKVFNVAAANSETGQQYFDTAAALNNEKYLTTDREYYFPPFNLSFYAAYPTELDLYQTSDKSYCFEYTLPADGKREDLIVAKNIDVSEPEEDESVPLTFHHALSCLTIQCKGSQSGTYTISSYKYNYCESGTFLFSDEGASVGSWTNQVIGSDKDSDERTFDYTAYTTIFEQILIPGKFEFVINWSFGVKTYENEISLELEPGTNMTISCYFNGDVPDPITFTETVNPWEEGTAPYFIGINPYTDKL